MRVVCGFDETIAIFVPKSLLRIEDLPTLALPTIAIKAVFGVFISYPFFLGSPLKINILKTATEITNKTIANGFSIKYVKSKLNAFG